MQKLPCLKWPHILVGYNYRFATISKFYPTVSGISIPSLKSIGQLNYNMPKLINPKSKKLTYWRSGKDYRVASQSARYQTAKEIIPISLKLIEQF